MLQNDQLIRHGKNWREMMDERCEEDNAEYDRWTFFIFYLLSFSQDNAEYDICTFLSFIYHI